MRYILGKCEADREQSGGKARSLAALSCVDVLVPEWFVIAPEAARASLPNAGGIESLSTSPRPATRAVSSDLWNELETALKTLCPNNEFVAVRSSAIDEDSVTTSFAGQLTSFLYVLPNEAANKVVAVWNSAFSDNVLAYRQQRSLPSQPGPPAVIVQRMIDATASGVVFGADPVTGNPNVAVVTAVYGLGTSLVSGECDADTWRVDPGGTITARVLANKIISHHAPVSGATGIRVADVEPDKKMRPVLSDDNVVQIAALARKLGRHFGHPQDVEWALADGQLYVLQSRPITSALQQLPRDGVLNLWDNSNIVESYSGVTTPLTFSFASYVYDEVYRQFCRVLRVPSRRIDANAHVFRNMLGFMQGRVYYNLLNWYRALALLPGFKVNRRFMEQMMGVKSSLPEELLDVPVAPDWQTRVLDSLHLLRSTFALITQDLRMAATIRAFYARLDSNLTVNRDALVGMRAEELTAYYSTVEARLLRRWDAPLINDFLAMIYFGLLANLCEKWLGNKGLANDLLRHQEGLISVEPSRRIQCMAKLAAGADSLVTVLCDGTLTGIVEAMDRHPDFKKHYQDYLDKFGDRCIEELKLESPTLFDDPMPLLRGVGHLARHPANRSIAEPTASETEDPLIAAERQIDDRLGTVGLRAHIFHYVLRNAKSRVRDRENLRFERTRVFGLVRRVFVTLGQRLCETGALDTPDDVFYLERNEVFGYVEGRGTTVSLRELVAVRRLEFAAFREAPPPPDRFETRGIVHANLIMPVYRPSDEGQDGRERTGIGCCAGIVRGNVRVVSDPRRDRLEPGEILAAKSTDPGWIVLFSCAAGLLVERGSLLSHSAIVCRELGIPSVVSVKGLTEWLKTGDIVELNGTSGVVRRIAGAMERVGP